MLLTSSHRYLPRIVFRCWLFSCEHYKRENPSKHKVEREKCEATGLCVSTRLQDSPLIHAVQCNGTWTWIITTFKCCVAILVYLSLKKIYCPVLAAGGGERRNVERWVDFAGTTTQARSGQNCCKLGTDCPAAYFNIPVPLNLANELRVDC